MNVSRNTNTERHDMILPRLGSWPVIIGVVLSEPSAAQEIPRWTVEQEARIGSIDDPNQALTRVGKVLLGPDTYIYVSQPDDQRIRVYNNRGKHVRDVGREGKGPGEFQQLWSMGFLGDSLYVTDQALRRISVFAPNGLYARQFQLVTPHIGTRLPEVYLPNVPDLLLSDGSALVKPSMVTAWLAAGKDRIPLFHLDRDGKTLDTIVQTVTQRGYVMNIRGRRLGAGIPFPDHPMDIFLADGSGVVLVDRRIAERRPASFHITRIDLRGDTVFRRAFSYQPLPVQRSLVTEAVNLIRERLSRLPLPAPPTASQIRSALDDLGAIPASLSPVSQIASDADGHIWVARERTARHSTTWWVLDGAGERIATVELGRNQTVMAASESTLLVTDLDDLNVPYVVKYRLLKSGRP